MIGSIFACLVVPIVTAVTVWVYVSKYVTDPELEREIDRRILAFCPKDIPEYMNTTAKYNLGFLQSGVIGFTSGAFLG